MAMSFLKDKIISILCFILIPIWSMAQQHTQFSNYLLNSVIINPGYAGSKSGTELMASYRRQWSNIEGSPTTFSASGHGLLANKKIGVAGVLLKDQIGVSDNLFLSVGASYRLKFNQYSLQFGLNGGFEAHKTNYGQISTIEDNDEAFLGSSSYFYKPIVGTGLYLFDERFYFGLSSPNLLQLSDGTGNSFHKKRHYYISSGKVFTLSQKVKVRPSFLAKFTSAAPVQFDLSGAVIWNELISGGLSYRTHAGVIWFIHVFINPKWTVAYAYDQMTNNLSSIDGGTHEITVIHNLRKNQKTIYSPRYF